jgi:ankyrin repeat protein
MRSQVQHARTTRRKWIVGVCVAIVLAAAGATVVQGQASLLEAVKSDNVAAARALLAKGADANAAEGDGTTALHWAVEHDNMDLAAALIAAGARARVANRYGVTPLHGAATNGNAKLIERLLQAGVDVNAALPGGDTALMIAARSGQPDALRALVNGGADVHARERQKGQTALMWAAAENNPAAIRVLAAAGANVREKSTGMFTPFLFAVRGGHIEAAGMLLETGADVNDTMPDGMSALVLALYNAHFELASFLLDHGADPNAAKQGWTALHQVAWSRRPNRGFNLPGAVPTGSLDSLDLVKKLVEKGADINARMSKEPRDGNRNMLNRIGATPFLMAAKSADVPLMRALLDAGANPKLTTVDGTTAVMVAAGVGVYGPGESPGTHEEALEAVKLAYEAGGGDVNAVDKQGETALHGAVYRGGAVPVLRFLIDKGARLDVENAKKWSPLFAAEGVVYASSGIRRYPEAAALLRETMVKQGIQADEAGRIVRGKTDTVGVPSAARPAASAAPAAVVSTRRTSADGVFTAAQVRRGQQIYARACSVCHLDTLMGDAVSPPLLGASLMDRFVGGSAHDMVSTIRGSMPQNAPDSLGDQGYVDLVSYLLNVNGSPDGSAELPIDVNALMRIVITNRPQGR